MAVGWVKKNALLLSFYKQNCFFIVLICFVWGVFYTGIYVCRNSFTFRSLGFFQQVLILCMYYGLQVLSLMYIKKKSIIDSTCGYMLMNTLYAVFLSLAFYTIVWYISVFISFIGISAAKQIGITNRILLLSVKFLPIGAAVYLLQHIYDAVLCSKNNTSIKDFLHRYAVSYAKFSILTLVCFFLSCIKMLLLYYRFTCISSLIIVITADVLYIFLSAAMMHRYVKIWAIAGLNH